MRVRLFSLLLLAALGVSLGALVAQAAQQKHGHTLTARLTGAAETPKGAPGASGQVVVTINDDSGRVCWTFSGLKGLGGAALAAHIHKGAPGTSGPVVVPFSNGFKMKGCVTAKVSLAKTIAEHPTRYYVNVHTVKYPQGVVRGQLQRAGGTATSTGMSTTTTTDDKGGSQGGDGY
jgi:hypothetical protein